MTTVVQPFVSARGLVKAYPGVLAVNDVNLDIREGEVLGLVGKNGAGKSTVIKMLAGVEKPDAGRIVVDGKEVPEHYDAHSAHDLGLAFMHQELANVQELSVAENVVLGSPYPRRAGIFVSWSRLREAAAEVLAELDSPIDARARVGDLTRVQQRMVMIARALYHRARLLVLDEPTASLDDEETRHLYDVIVRFKESGRAVVYVSHRLHEIFEITDRVVVMRDGGVVDERRTEGFDEDGLIAAIVGESAVVSGLRSSDPTRLRDGDGDRVLLRVRGLSRADAVRDVGFDLHRSEVLGLGGLIGSGRTELVRLLVGADRAESGTVEVKGERVSFRSPRDAFDRGLALVPEDRRSEGLVLDFSVRENITLATLAKHRIGPTPFQSRSSERRAAGSMIEKLRIRTPNTEQTVSFLSGGNQQKVVLAKWLEHALDIVIFDEPTQGIDVEAKEEVLLLIRRLAEEAKGVIVITSEFGELVTIADRVLVLREGRITGELANDEISEEAIVKLCYATDAAENR